MKLVLVLGNQLFDPELIIEQLGSHKGAVVFMKEDNKLCTHFRYHKHKIMFVLGAMRAHAARLKKNDFKVHYEDLESSKGTYEESLKKFIKDNNVSEIFHFEIEDRFFETKLEKVFKELKIRVTSWTTPMFLTTRDEFKSYLKSHPKPFMKTFYEGQRKRLKILVDSSLKPVGGQWSFDEENRKPLPKGLKTPDLPKVKSSKFIGEVAKVVDKHFSDHPGDTDQFWLPLDKEGAFEWLEDFCKKRLSSFGPYEDALAPQSDFVFHSVLTPFLNFGLLTPKEVVDFVLTFAKKHKTPMNSLEGFIRQVIGWREFIRGIYQNFGAEQEKRNFWKHEHKLTHHWYDGTTGIEPLDQVIKKTIRFGYAHHIERLMVASNLMLLLNISPKEAHRWFMEMFIDSAEWVMGPNVYGMGLFSDGGIFATKPYICGSNYYRKMGGYKSGSWQEGVDGLYWTFIDDNREFFLKNHRMSMAVRTFDKMSKEKKKALATSAEKLRRQLTKN